jgi:ribose 1,5-bisphosphate isomerase
MTPSLPALPEAVQPYLDELASGPIGASRTIRVMNDMLCAVADGWSGSGDELLRLLTETASHYVATRGMNTPAIGNALVPLVSGLERLADEEPDVPAIRGWIDARRTAYNEESLRNVELMADHGARLFAGMKTILAFDYSSTMLAILTRLGEDGTTKRLIVPESRCLDGGRPIAEQATAAGHEVAFVPDMAVGVFIQESEAVLIGAETIFANGDCWNTIGSYPLAELARIHGVPFYVATELIKIDRRSYDGFRPPVRPRDFGAVLGYPGGFSCPERITTVAPELDTTPASLITGYITPVGILRPEQIEAEARKLYP